MMLTRHLLQQKITLLEPLSEDRTATFAMSAARELSLCMNKIEALEKITATSVTLPYYSASPVCEIEVGYAAGVSDYREAIQWAGYPIEGDDQFALMLTSMCFQCMDL